jgi:hypothetical protein
MSYFARLASQSQLDIAGQRPADGPRSAGPVEPGAPDIVELATSIEIPDDTASAPVRLAPEASAAPRAAGPRADTDREALRVADGEHVPGLAAGPERGLMPEAARGSPASGLAALPSGDIAASREAALLTLREVIDWIAAGAPGDSGEAGARGVGPSRVDDWRGIAPAPDAPGPSAASLAVPERGEGVPDTLRRLPDEPRNESGPRRPAPMRAEAMSVEHLSVSEAARPGEPPPEGREASVQPRVEEVIEVSIGTISVRVEAPPPEVVAAPRESATGPVREAASDARRQERVSRLGRHYL